MEEKKIDKIKSQSYYNGIIVFRDKVITELPTIFISIFLFLTLWNFFGKYEMILSSFLTLFFKIKYLQEFRAIELIKNYMMFLGIAIMSFLAGQTLALCIVINLLLPFFIVYFLTNKFTPKSYFVYGMAFVFMQLIPIPISSLPTRIGALLYSFGVLNIALHLSSKYLRKGKRYERLKGKILLLPKQLRKLIIGEDFSAERIEIMKAIPTMNQLIYSTRNYKYLATEYGKVLYLFMMIFQRFNYYIDGYIKRRENLDREFFLELAELLEKIGQEMSLEGNKGLIKDIEKFQNSKSIQLQNNREDINDILNLFKLALSEINAKDHNRNARKWRIPKEEDKIKNIHKFFQLDIFQIRFALRLSIVLCIAFTFSFGSKLEHSYWVPMSSFLMLMPYAEESKLKITNRILGTLFGIVICWILMSLHQSIPYKIFIVILMTVFMYTAPITSWTMTMYSTCYGMTLATITLGLGDAIVLRLAYVALAAIITWVANHYIFPNTAKREFKNSIKELFQKDKKMLEEVKKSYYSEGDINHFRHLLMESNMLSNEIKEYTEKNLTERERNFYAQMLEINYTLIVEMEQLNSYFYYGKRYNEIRENIVFEEVFENLEDALGRVYKSYTHDELISFMNTNNKNEVFGKLEEELYFNEIIIKCMNSIKRLENLHTIK